MAALADVAGLLVRAHGQISRLVRAAPPFTNPAHTLRSLITVPAASGFDGQFYYRLAVAPFAAGREVAGVTFDHPALRGSRLGFGVLAYVLSAGHAAAVPAVLVLTNVVLLALLGTLTGLLARSTGRAPAWGLLVVGWPGFAYSLALDTAEILAAVLMVAALLAFQRERPGLAAGALSAAVVTRESVLAVVVGLGVGAALVLLRSGRDRHARGVLAACVAGVGAYLADQVYGLVQFGAVPLRSSGQANLGVPLVGLVRALQRSLPPTRTRDLLDLTAIALVLGLVALGAVLVRRTSAGLPLRAAWVVCAALVLSLSNPWVSAASSLRAGTELMIMTTVLLLYAAPRSRPGRSVFAAYGWSLAVTVLTVGTLWDTVPTRTVR